MNGNDVISIITSSIASAFLEAEGYKVYKENIKQDFDTPAFYVAEINHTHTPLIGRASRKRFSMSVKYYPDESNTDEVKQELHGVAAQLLEIFKIMSYKNNTIKGYNMESRIQNDVLHFMFDVKIKTLKAKETNKFGPLEVEVNVKD
ncbi:hypothetical protein SDC9_116525 [bioreactor metagenome]|uniref:Phage protein n=1 Tax=bioreactor metagenome TaxID=1076179 RepID=A0A645BWL2_9ZZZZ